MGILFLHVNHAIYNVENKIYLILLKDILSDIEKTNQEVIASLNKVFSLGMKANKQGLCNFIADRLDTHEKHGWMLRASMKDIG